MEGNFFKAVVEITQIPSMEKKEPELVSWLSDPFGDGRVYCTKFSIGEEMFSWKFYLKVISEDLAIEEVYSFLTNLKELYPGLDGTVKVKIINSLGVDNQNPNSLFFEYVLPKPPYVKNKISLLKKILTLYEVNTSHHISIYILWQAIKTDINLIGRLEEGRKLKYDFNYKMRIFIEVIPQFDAKINKSIQLAELMGKLNSLFIEARNLNGDRAYLKEIPSSIKKNIIMMAPTFTSFVKLDSGIMDYDSGKYFQGANTLDFTILPNMPLQVSDIIAKRKLNFLPLLGKKESRLLLGQAYINDVLTERPAYLNLSNLVHHVFIGGLSGVGKSRFLGYFEHQLYESKPKLGVLIINLMKKNETMLFKFDQYLTYGEGEFRTPYFFEDIKLQNEEREQYFEQLAELLISSLGLKNVVATNMENVIVSYYDKYKTLSKTLNTLFANLLDFFEKNPYSVKFQTNIMRAIKNRVLKLLASPIVESITNASKSPPKWFLEWKLGKTIYIDLSICKKGTKRLLVNLIFQMIRMYMPELKGDELRNAIIIDEASEILEKPLGQSYDDDEYVTRFHLENVFTYFLQAFRSRGVALILADQKPSRLFESVYSLPSIKILFRLAHSCSPIFTNNPDEQDSLALLRNRDVIVNDGVNGRKYAIRTKDHHFHVPQGGSPENNSRLTPNNK